MKFKEKSQPESYKKTELYSLIPLYRKEANTRIRLPPFETKYAILTKV